MFGDASLGPGDQALKDALAQIGLVEGAAIQIVYRYAKAIQHAWRSWQTNSLPEKPDLLMALGGDVIRNRYPPRWWICQKTQFE